MRTVTGTENWWANLLLLYWQNVFVQLWNFTINRTTLYYLTVCQAMESTHRQLKITVSCSLTWQTDPENMASKTLILPDWAPTKIMHYGLQQHAWAHFDDRCTYAQVLSTFSLLCMSLTGLIIPGVTPTFQTANNGSWAEPGNEATDTFSAPHTDNISYMCVYTKIAHENTCVQKTSITNL